MKKTLWGCSWSRRALATLSISLGLILLLPVLPTWAADVDPPPVVDVDPSPAPIQKLHPDDAKIRTFERWSSSWYNPKNLYNWTRAREDFNGYRFNFWAAGLSIAEQRARVIKTAEQGKVLQVKYPAGGVGTKESGVAFPWVLKCGYRELNLSYRVRFEPGFDFVTSGKLPGLCGATDTNGCYRYTGGNPPNGNDGFSVRVVWHHGDGRLATYVYHAQQEGTYGDVFVWTDSAGAPVKIVPGHWYTIELHVVMNDPGVANGIAEAFLDGRQVSYVDDLLFRNDTVEGRSIQINEMYFNTFHGGNKDSDAPSKTQYADFDDFKLFIYRAFDVEPLDPGDDPKPLPIDAGEQGLGS